MIMTIEAYPKDVPIGLHRDDLSGQMKRFADAFNLKEDVLHSTNVRSTSYDPKRKIWTLMLSPSGKVVECKHIVLCTGIGSWIPHVPEVPGREAYRGVSIHNADFKNGKELAAQGIKASTNYRELFGTRQGNSDGLLVGDSGRVCKHRI